ncbi:hypothetical protein K435DRAFT_864138 [Dendrothele bispora CBS 962.96]|uniref:Uncharacterized protein n=1 Tax=Dendrothele bispora (strain CBS 962.96) TaxID=1314807 RepID=A0A4S8LMS9_DENBC|nr:hypothetical protein K435DRAFT_864138 [Dendrothele bispora CBS 962.96]
MTPHHEIYSRLLFTAGQGFPLWDPTPNENPEAETPCHGVQIGDIGWFQGGKFNVFREIRMELQTAHRKDHSGHPISVPTGYQAEGVTLKPFRPSMTLKTADLVINNNRHNNNAKISYGEKEGMGIAAVADVNPLATVPIGGGGNAIHQSSYLARAALTLERGAFSHDVLARDKFKDWIEENAKTLYSLSRRSGYSVPNGGLFLVTGFTKTDSWCIETSLKVSRSGSMSLTAHVLSVFKLIFLCKRSRAVEVRDTPRHSVTNKRTRNQSVFLRGWKIMLNPKFHQMLMHTLGQPAGETPVEATHTEDIEEEDREEEEEKEERKAEEGEEGEEDKTEEGEKEDKTEEEGEEDKTEEEGEEDKTEEEGKEEEEGRRTRQRRGRRTRQRRRRRTRQRRRRDKTEEERRGQDRGGRGGRGQDRGGQDRGRQDRGRKRRGGRREDKEHAKGAEYEPYHPSDIINKYLLEKYQDVKVALTHDDVWCSVLKEDEDVMPSSQDLIARVEEKFSLGWSHEQTCVFFEFKTGTTVTSRTGSVSEAEFYEVQMPGPIPTPIHFFGEDTRAPTGSDAIGFGGHLLGW